MVRLLVCVAFGVFLVCGSARPALPQTDNQEHKSPKLKDQMFSGMVVAIDDASLTASRAGQGKVAATKTFAITPETRFEGGKPAVNSRVTVRYVTTETGELAIHVIVRGVK
jgi:hypothetical protein